jgi:hypothetical protein
VRAVSFFDCPHASIRACRFVPDPETSTVRLNDDEALYARDLSVEIVRGFVLVEVEEDVIFGSG